jgi:NAD(P)-dependent dehydrogenase (short-subunit alcohol dehydrogenase family)
MYDLIKNDPITAEVSMSKWFSMTGKRALVTGASMSIGRSIALGFADHGASVAVHYSAAADAQAGLPNAARETLEELRARGVDSCLVEADLESEGASRRTVELATAQLGAIDVLVVCASIQTRIPFSEVTPDQIKRQTAINLCATVELLQAALPPMKDRNWGRILMIGSINQLRPAPDLAIYAALKSAQHNLCVNLARQYAPFNVMINTLSPGLVATERNRWRRADEEEWRRIQTTAAAPIGRAALPDEMVGAAILLCSDAASYITGVDLMATGGAHLPMS